MRVLHSMVAVTVLLSVHSGWALDREEPQADPGPWWLPAAAAPKDRDPAKTDPQPRPRERLVYRLGNLPATDVVRTVNELLQSEHAAEGPGAPPDETVVLAEVVTNSALISGRPDKIHEVAKLIQQLDRKPKMVSVEVILAAVKLADGQTFFQGDGAKRQVIVSRDEVAALMERLTKMEGVEILARPRITTLDSQPAFIQIGQRVPRVVTRGTKEVPVFETQLDNVGLILGLTPRISPDNVVTMELDVEKSQLSAEGQGVPVGTDRNGNVVRSPRIEVLTTQTTVRVPSNQAVLLSGLVTKEGDRKVELLVIVAPDVVEAPE